MLKKTFLAAAIMVLGCLNLHASTTNAGANAGPNRPDTANGEAPLILMPGDTISVTLDGTFSFDPITFTEYVLFSWTDGTTTIEAGFPAGFFPTFTWDTPGVKTVTLTATNSFGATSSDTITVTILDGSQVVCAPELTTPAQDVIVEADGTGNTAALQAWLANNGGAVATDICETPVWTNDYTAQSLWKKGQCPVVEYVKVTFTASDAAGHTVSTSAKFKIIDTTPPPLNWTVDGDPIPDYTQISVRKRDLPLKFQVTPADLVSTSTLKKSYKFFSKSGDVDFEGKSTAILKQAAAGARVRIYFQATDRCGNSSATEWVEVQVLENNSSNYHERCREGLDDDNESDRWNSTRRAIDADFGRSGYCHCRD